ncbi:MAG TPA: Ig-like domain-containing protein [Nitrososphaeraceae archaeon]|nr:Ig-like domain-containing protein [Nitrososphaeraceae archaeon]
MEKEGQQIPNNFWSWRKLPYVLVIASPVLLFLVSSNNLIPHDPAWSTAPWYSFLVSLLVVFSGTSVYLLLLQWSRQRSESKNKELKNHTHCEKLYRGSISDIIRDGNYYASLPRFQFLLWTFAISFTFVSVYLIRISGGEFGFPTQIPNEVLALMGISVIVPAISTPLSGYKYDVTLAQKPPCEEEITPVSDMLMESGKPALFRYQMFLWTLIGIAIYLLLFFSDAITTITNTEEFKNCKSNCGSDPLEGFSLPNVDPSLVILTGLSQGGYLSGKLVARTPIKIERVIRGTETLTILGSNFLTGGILLINKKRSPKDPAKWSDSIIEVPVDDIDNWHIIEVITNESTQAKYERGGPEVTYIIPADGEENVSRNTRELEVGFSEPIDKSSIIFTLTNTKTRGNVATTKLDSNEKDDIAKFALALGAEQRLDPSTKYDASIKSTLRNKVGKHMKKDKIWSFITSAT